MSWYTRKSKKVTLKPSVCIDVDFPMFALEDKTVLCASCENYGSVGCVSDSVRLSPGGPFPDIKCKGYMKGKPHYIAEVCLLDEDGREHLFTAKDMLTMDGERLALFERLTNRLALEHGFDFDDDEDDPFFFDKKKKKGSL